jgi:hypothetical protein
MARPSNYLDYLLGKYYRDPEGLIPSQEAQPLVHVNPNPVIPMSAEEIILAQGGPVSVADQPIGGGPPIHELGGLLRDVDPDIADIIAPEVPQAVDAQGLITSAEYPVTPDVLPPSALKYPGLAGILNVPPAATTLPAHPTKEEIVDDPFAHLAHLQRQEVYGIGSYDTTVRAEFNAIYQEVKTGRGALTEDEFNTYILDQIASLLLSPEYQASSYFEAGDKLSVTSEKTALGAAKKALQDWYTALDPSGKGDGDSLRWLNVIEGYGVEREVEPTTVIVDAGSVGTGADAGDADIDAELVQLLEDPSLYQALWQQERGIPATGRTMYEEWLADQWRTPAINYILGVDPEIGGLSEDLTYGQYLESIRGEPVGGLDPDLVRAFEALDRTGQGSAFERFSTVPGLGNIEQYLYRSTLMEQGIPPWLATNLTQQRYAGQDLYRIGRGLEPGAPSFFSSLIDMDPLAFGSGGSMSATPTATPTSLAMPMDEFVSPFSGLMVQNEDPLTEFVSPFANIV